MITRVAMHESVFGPSRHFLRLHKTVGIEAKRTSTNIFEHAP
jgi:hypothetical protein